jgi:hypothetical protein
MENLETVLESRASATFFFTKNCIDNRRAFPLSFWHIFVALVWLLHLPMQLYIFFSRRCPMRSVKRLSVLVLWVGMMALSAPPNAWAAACVWNGSVSTDWINSANWSTCNSSIPSSGDTVTIGTAANQPILTTTAPSSGSFGTVQINSGGTLQVSSGGSLTTGSSMTVAAGGTLDLQGGTVTINSNSSLALGGTLNVSSGTLNVGSVSGNSINYVSGSVITINGGVVNVTGRIARDTGAIGNTVTYSQSGGTVTVVTVGSSSSTRAGFDIGAPGSSFTWSGGTIAIQRATSNSSDYLNVASTSNVTGGTLQIGNSNTPASQIIKINSTVPIFNFAVNSTNSPSAQLVTNSPAVKGNITISGGTLDANNLAISIAGNFSNSGTFTPGSGTVTFNGSGTQYLTANTSTTFNNLTVNSGSTLIETVAADNVTVSGTLTNSGTIRKSQTVSGAGAKTFGLAGAFNSANLTIDVTTPGTLSNLQVDRIDSNHSNASVYEQTGRYWTITAVGDSFTTNLTLPRNNSGAPTVCKYLNSGTNWSCAANSNTSNTVTRNNISSFSDWAVGNDAPTAIGLGRFKAKVTPQHQVKLKWKTGAELEILGFNVYRQIVGTNQWVRLNAKTINARNIGQVMGATYTRLDKKVKAGTTYRYKLEVLYTDTTSGWSKIVKITASP